MQQSPNGGYCSGDEGIKRFLTDQFIVCLVDSECRIIYVMMQEDVMPKAEDRFFPKGFFKNIYISYI